MLKAYPTTDSVLSMKKSPATLQDNYKYDALDRLTTRNATHRFYQNDRIATEVEGANTRRFIAFDAQPLAVQEGQTTSLLATDLQTSVLQHASAAGTQAYAYTPYGHHPAENGITRLLAFNGEHPEAVTGHYLLGQGYRAYNPVLMRFNSPDSWSPFGEGENNAYAYPTNPLMMQDPTGHFWVFLRRGLKGLLNSIGARTPGTAKAAKAAKAAQPSMPAQPTVMKTSLTKLESSSGIDAAMRNKYLAKVATALEDPNRIPRSTLMPRGAVEYFAPVSAGRKTLSAGSSTLTYSPVSSNIATSSASQSATALPRPSPTSIPVSVSMIRG